LIVLALGGLCGFLFFGGIDSVGEIDPRAYDRASAGTHWESSSVVCPGPYHVPIELFVCLREHDRRKLDKCPRLERATFGVDRLGRTTVGLEGSTPRCDGEPAGRFGVGLTLISGR
jgi:hypothetical protein